jgi:hypothetical protein
LPIADHQFAIEADCRRDDRKLQIANRKAR